MLFDPEPSIVDTLNRVDNRRVTQAVDLFRRIIEDLDITGFSLQDIIDNYNTGTRILGGKEEDGSLFKVERVRYGESHLQTLVSLGLLVYDENSGMYNVTDASHVARFVMGDDFLHTSLDPIVLSCIPIKPDTDEFRDYPESASAYPAYPLS